MAGGRMPGRPWTEPSGRVSVPAMAWNDVAVRVADYLRALGVRDERLLVKATRQIMERASARAAEDAADKLPYLAMQETQAFIDERITMVLELERQPSPRELAAARGALLSGELPSWAEVLTVQHPPQGLVQALRAALPEPAPPPVAAPMQTQSISFPSPGRAVLHRLLCLFRKHR